MEDRQYTQDYEKAYASAVRSLGLREHGQEELRKKLLGKGFDTQIVLEVIESLLEHEYLNDFSYAGAYILKARRKFKSDMLIKYELLEKGVGKADIDRAFEELAEENDESNSEFERAMSLLEKTVSSMKIDRNFQNKQEKYKEKQRIKEKLSRKLSSKGFELSVIIKAVEKTVETLEL